MSENLSQTETVAEIDLFAYLETLWRYRWTILLLFFAAVAVAAALSFWVIPPTYEAASLVQVGQDLSLGTPDVYRNLLTSQPVLVQTAQALGVRVDELEKGILRSEILPNTNLIRLVAQAESPARAEAIGEAWQASFKASLQAMQMDRLEQQLTVQRARLKGLRASWAEISGTAGGVQATTLGRQILVASDVVAAAGEVERLQQVKAQVSEGKLLDLAVVAPFAAPKEPVAPRKALNVAVAGFMALLVGTFGAYFAEAWRTRTSLMG